MFTSLLTIALSAQCQVYSLQCVCGPAVPFEGFQMFLEEKCDQDVKWFGQYGERHYTKLSECTEAIAYNKDCRALKTP